MFHYGTEMMHLIIAGNYEQFKIYLTAIPEKEHEHYKYVHLEKQLHEFRPAKILYVGDYWLNPIMRTGSGRMLLESLEEENVIRHQLSQLKPYVRRPI